MFPVLLWKLCLDDLILKEGRKEGPTGFSEGLTGSDKCKLFGFLIHACASVGRGEKGTFNWKIHRLVLQAIMVKMIMVKVLILRGLHVTVQLE